MNVMIFLLGGCAGWGLHSLLTARKRRKLVNEITSLIGKVSDELKKVLEDDDDEDSGDVIDISDRIKAMEETAHPTDDEPDSFYLISPIMYESEAVYDKVEYSFRGNHLFLDGNIVIGPESKDEIRAYINNLIEVCLVGEGDTIYIRDPKTKTDYMITVVAC